MLVFITGVPGSGKTYKAVKHIYDHFGINSKNKDNRYLFCYTNITNFDFSKVDERVKPLDFDDLKYKLSLLYDLYKNKKADDKTLIEEANKLSIHKSLFVIDEAHNFFQVKDEILVWWLTYHRHLYQDIYLITQNLSLIDRKYKPLAEYFYKAVPASLRLNKKVFKYNVFIDSRMTKASKVKVEKLKFDKNVIDLYHSGDEVKAPNFIMRFILISFIVFIFLALFFYFYLKSLESDTKKNTDQNKLNKSSAVTHKIPENSQFRKSKNDKIEKNVPLTQNFLDDYKYYYQLVCFKNKCIVDNDFTISKYFILALPDISNTKIYYKANFPTNQLIYLATDIDLSKFKPGGNYEETNNTNNIHSLF
ncbi:zonular occludens toxin domain-containing protein [Caminibacter sp.]